MKDKTLELLAYLEDFYDSGVNSLTMELPLAIDSDAEFEITSELNDVKEKLDTVKESINWIKSL